MPPAPSDAPQAQTQAEPARDLSPPASDASADEHYAYARQLFNQRDYAAAARSLEQAYQRDPRPLFLFNAGQALRKASLHAEAIRLYQRFLVAAPDHPLAVEAREYVSTLQQLAKQDERNKQIELSMELTQQELDRLRRQRTPIYKRAWFWPSLIGVAATAAGIAIGITLYNNERRSEAGTLSF